MVMTEGGRSALPGSMKFETDEKGLRLRLKSGALLIVALLEDFDSFEVGRLDGCRAHISGMGRRKTRRNRMCREGSPRTR